MRPSLSTIALGILPAATCSLLAQAEHAPSNASPERIDEVVVTASRLGATESVGYRAPQASSASLKAEIPLLETPQAVSSIPRQLIEDQGSHKLEDILRNSAGVSVGGNHFVSDFYRIRGFDASSQTFQDGLRSEYDGSSAETFGLERVEVVKGPASTLYGQAPLGGFVNLISKKPKHEFGGEVGTSYDSFGGNEQNFDINLPLVQRGQADIVNIAAGPSSKSGKSPQVATTNGSSNQNFGAYFRLLGLRRDSANFIDHFEYERYFIAPSLTFEFGDDTTLTLLGHYLHDEGQVPPPLPARGTVLPNRNGKVPIERFLGVPGKSSKIELETSRLGYEFSHRVNDLLTLRQNLGYYRVEQHWNATVYNASLEEDQRTLNLYPFNYERGLSQRLMVDTAADLNFFTGSVEHLATVGVDAMLLKHEVKTNEIDYDDFPNSYVTLDMFQPRYRNLSIPPRPITSGYTVEEQSVGIYLQDHARLTDTVTLTGGVRYEKLWIDNTGINGIDPNEADDSALTPKVGLTWEFVPGLAVYGNYSQSYRAQWGTRDADGKQLDPEVGDSYEAGLKYALLDGRLTGMASVFQLTRENVATSNLSTPDPNDVSVSGEQRSRGIELETQAELTPGLELSAAYTFIDAEVTKDNDIPEGTRLLNVPEHQFNTWLKYQFGSEAGWLEGFGLGVGGSLVADQAGDTRDSFSLPAYGLLNAGLFYENERFSAQVNFNNFLDESYFPSSYNDLNVLPGKPFNVEVGLTWKF